MLGAISKQVLARFIAIYVIWPLISLGFIAMGLTPDFLYSLFLGPNWASIIPHFFTQEVGRWLLVIVGLIGLAWLAIWTRRFASSEGIEIQPSRAQQSINGRDYDEIRFAFVNKIGKPVCISNPRIKETANFPIPIAAARNITDGFCELKFINNADLYVDRERNFQPNDSAVTGIAIEHPMNKEFYSYVSNIFRTVLRWPKYFRLRYDIIIAGEKKTVEIIR